MMNRGTTFLFEHKDGLSMNGADKPVAARRREVWTATTTIMRISPCFTIMPPIALLHVCGTGPEETTPKALAMQ